jgi:hypothetical protein
VSTLYLIAAILGIGLLLSSALGLTAMLVVQCGVLPVAASARGQVASVIAWREHDLTAVLGEARDA